MNPDSHNLELAVISIPDSPSKSPLSHLPSFSSEGRGQRRDER